MSAIWGPEIVKSGLVLYLDAGNQNSYPGTGTTWTDISRNNNNGTLTNGPTFNSANGGSIVFDGSNDTVNVTYDFRSSWTYECWSYHNVVNGFAFLGQGTFATNAGLHIWFASDTNLRFGMYANDTDFTPSTTSINTWYHYVFTYNHSSPFTKQMYRNSVSLTGTPQQTQAQYTGTGTVRIGATYSSGSPVSFANGRIAMAKIYNRILSASEILQNYNATKSRFGL